MNKNNTILGLCWATTSIAYVFSNLTVFFFFEFGIEVRLFLFWIMMWTVSCRPWPHRVALSILTTDRCWVCNLLFVTPKAVLDYKDMTFQWAHSAGCSPKSHSLQTMLLMLFFSLTVCCSPQLPAAITHHVVWKPLRLTAAVYSCEVSGCLRGLHWPALPCHSLLDCSLQQGTNSLSAYCWWWFLFRAWNDVTDVSVPLLGGDLWLSSKIASEEGYLEGLLDRHK